MREKHWKAEDAIVTNIMADGSICEDLSTYIKSPDQLPELTLRMMRMFISNGYKVLAEQRKQEMGD